MRKDGRVLTDEDIARMGPDERRLLIARLARPLDDVVKSTAQLRAQRRLRIGLAAVACGVTLIVMGLRNQSRDRS